MATREDTIEHMYRQCKKELFTDLHKNQRQFETYER